MQMYNSSKKATENTVDELTGEQLTFENVVVCFADMDAYAGDSHDVQEVQYIKGGDAYLFTRGGVQVGRWEKTYPTNPLKLYTKSGEEMTLNRGKTYFALVDNDELSNFSCQYAHEEHDNETHSNCVLPHFDRRAAGRLRLSAQRQ